MGKIQTFVKSHFRKNKKSGGKHHVKGHSRKIKQKKVDEVPKDIQEQTLEEGDKIYCSEDFPDYHIVVPDESMKYAGRWDAENDVVYLDEETLNTMDYDDIKHIIKHEIEEMRLVKDEGLSVEEAHKQAYDIPDEVFEHYDKFKSEYVFGGKDHHLED